MSVLVKFWQEPRLKMWQKFDAHGITHKEFVPPGQTVNGKSCCSVLRWMMENIQRECPDKWCNNSWTLHHDNVPAHVSLMQQVLASTQMTVIPPPSLLIGPCHLWFFPIPEDEIEAQGPTFWQQWKDPDRKTGHDEDAHAKLLPAVLLILKNQLGWLYQCQRGLLWWGWREIEILVSG